MVQIATAFGVAACSWCTTAMAEEASVSKGAAKIASARVGLSSHYKLGSWTPIVVEVAGTGDSRSLRINVIASDNDGVATTASSPLTQAAATGGPRQAVVYTQVGRVRSPIRVTLADGDAQLDELVLTPKSQSNASAPIVPLPATSELIVALGSAKYGLADAFPAREDSSSQSARALIEIKNVSDLPVEWFGYDAADVVVLLGGDGKFCRALAGDKRRFAALQRWVELGGRLIILCGGTNAESLLNADGPLAPFAPGKLDSVVSLSDASELSNFAAGAPGISGAAIRVPRLTDVEGKIETYAGRRPIDLPLIIRTPRGFGEITFVALEFNEPPLANWPGRTTFFQTLLRPYLSEAAATDNSQRLATSGIDDLSGALRQQLGRSFSSVRSFGFSAVAALAIAYLLVLGPLDYFIIHRWLRRPLAAWITFPLIVLGFTAAALAIGNWSKGSTGTHINRLTLIDIDTISNQLRSTLWSTVFTPNANRFNLAVKPASPPDTRHPTPDTLFSWWGLPGPGIGGMQAAGSDFRIIDHGYRYGPELASLEELPILASGTKSLIAHTAAPSAATLNAQLSDSEDLLAGTITNNAGLTLQNVRLFYGSWGYQLGNIRPGQQVEITDELSPRKAKTILTRDALASPGTTAAQVEGRLFSAEQATPMQILNLMMFYDVAGGRSFANVPNRCQSRIDLSRQLELGRAILVADVVEVDANLIDQNTGQPLDGADEDTNSVYRFILPVKKSPPGDTP